MSNRIAKLNSLLAQEISSFYVSEISDIFFSITKVDVAPDLKTAKVWVSFISNRGSGFSAMKRELPGLQRYLSGRLSMRQTPKIELILDTGIEYEENISKILRDNQ